MYFDYNYNKNLFRLFGLETIINKRNCNSITYNNYQNIIIINKENLFPFKIVIYEKKYILMQSK